jgi:hypothetical protein
MKLVGGAVEDALGGPLIPFDARLGSGTGGR